MSSGSEEEVEESMMELVQRAEAFLAAFPSRSSSSSGTSSAGSSSSSSNNTSLSRNLFGGSQDDDSFTTAGNSSLSSISISHNSSVASGSGSELERSNLSGSSSISMASVVNSSGSSAETGAVDLSTVSSVFSYLQRTISEDCVELVPVVPVIDLCSPRVQRNLIRRIANAAPVVDSITLDDTVYEAPDVPAMAPAVQQPEQEQPVAVVNEYMEPPPAKRVKEVPASLNLSSDAGAEPTLAVSCPICFDSIFKKAAASTICGHLFCHACISQEIQLRKQCPLCKRKLTRANVHPIYFN